MIGINIMSNFSPLTAILALIFIASLYFLFKVTSKSNDN